MALGAWALRTNITLNSGPAIWSVFLGKLLAIFEVPSSLTLKQEVIPTSQLVKINCIYTHTHTNAHRYVYGTYMTYCKYAINGRLSTFHQVERLADIQRI